MQIVDNELQQMYSEVITDGVKIMSIYDDIRLWWAPK